AFPTETVYGLGALATDDAAIARVFEAKGRPAVNPLILHVATTAASREFAAFDDRAEALGAAFWPGPLTLILPLRQAAAISPRAVAGLDTVAVRVPGHAVAQSLLAQVGGPVAAPSANRSGRVSPTTAAHVLADLDGRIDLVLDGGPVQIGVESTVLDLSRPGRVGLLRPGGLTRAAIAAVTRPLDEPSSSPGEPVRSPGLLLRHYAPRTALRLEATDVAPDEALLAFGPMPPTGAVATRNLSAKADLAEAAHNLYAMLRELDAVGARRIAVMELPATGLGEALVDRLRRAAETPPDTAP
ncbi:MAG: threonylcarbamoyl-AMP synthase, partial [Geminicoccaceae bacterium]|nr:threonylcarbamoyl-AMP synthase [Geminicoccaceae bacterium]